MQPPRAAWNEFPDVLIHASESAVKNHPRYQAAKCGNAEAAVSLVEETIDPAQIATLRAFLRGRKATLVSVHAFEDEGVNAIPEVFAEALANSLGLPHASGIVQANIVGHTGADGYARLARQPAFEGEVQPDADYVIVDDFVGMGGTLANLKGYIESKGGRVLAAVTLTGKPYSARLRPEPDQLSKLRAKHGQDLEHFWRERFGHGFDALTQSEARYLSRSPDADTIRNRLAEKEPARDRGLREEDPESGVTPIRARRDAEPVRRDEGPADAGPSVSRRRDAAPLGQGGTKANDRSAAALGTEATRLPS
jgi:adenine/guanine phosphoribosyltransferase-like PRPP-binding protein